ncbi:MAG: hypothetical protein IPH58_16760 [Sphingobacteriales bacterium]|nr:hypothetical protein [Sphingobacteriales bacterium]
MERTRVYNCDAYRQRPDGKQLSDAMPYKYFTFKDDELKAIYAFLHQVK